MKTPNTPGPWQVWKDQDPTEPWLVVGPSGDFTCQIAMENTNAKANAHLIAAAPEMLDACEQLHKLSGENGISLDLVKLAEFQNTVFRLTAKAIAKAQGD